VWAVCGENISGKNVQVGIARWRTLTGSDQAWANDLFDGNSGEPTFPRYQEVGYLPAGGTWNAEALATIQDSSATECDTVEIQNTVRWYQFSDVCSSPPEGQATATMFVNTCNFGASAKFFQQSKVVVTGLSYRPSYLTTVNVYRNGVLAAYEVGLNSCLRVATTTSGCN
jgi:hypothetical protein